MCSNECVYYFYVTIIIIFILVGIKNKFFNNTHWYEYFKFTIGICFITFIVFIIIVFIQKMWNINKIVPEKITIQTIVVNS